MGDQTVNTKQQSRYATGTMYTGITSPIYDSIKEALVDFRGFVAEEMFDKDDRALLFEITSDGHEQVIDSYLPLEETH